MGSQQPSGPVSAKPPAKGPNHHPRIGAVCCTPCPPPPRQGEPSYPNPSEGGSARWEAKDGGQGTLAPQVLYPRGRVHMPGKRRAKNAPKDKQDDEDLDALLAEFAAKCGPPKTPTPAPAGGAGSLAPVATAPLPSSCAFCYKILADEPPALKCGKCERRVYCSQECRAADWGGEGGQGHQMWCPLRCGEENVDWEVRPISEAKGLGLIARRPFARGDCIIAERLLTLGELRGAPPSVQAAVGQLMPDGGTLEAKFDLNRFGRGAQPPALSVRIARANHQCRPNAYHYELDGANLLIARLPIAAGEEICIPYQPFLDASKPPSVEANARVLREKWGIVCPDDCPCRQAGLVADWRAMWELDAAILRLGQEGKTDVALRKVHALLRLHDKHQSSAVNYIRTYNDGVSVAVAKKAQVAEAKRLAALAYEMCAATFGPGTSKSCRWDGLRNNIASHPNYLSF